MRRLSAPALFVLLSGCSSQDNTIRFDDTATMLNTADPRADKQLVSGFFGNEGLGRWTGRTFRAILKPPPAAARKGAIVVLRFGVPKTSMDVLGSIHLSAIVNGVALSAHEYSKDGQADYIRDVPATAFRDGNATVDFVLDKVLPASGNERRDLGVVVTTIGFEAK